MWLVTQHGFYNIIQYPEDKAKDLLTVKARRREDLVAFYKMISLFDGSVKMNIEESEEADYRFRLKLIRPIVDDVIGRMVYQIDYDKTKTRLQARHPDRMTIYTTVWAMLAQMQANEWSDTDA